MPANLTLHKILVFSLFFLLYALSIAIKTKGAILPSDNSHQESKILVNEDLLVLENTILPSIVDTTLTHKTRKGSAEGTPDQGEHYSHAKVIALQVPNSS